MPEIELWVPMVNGAVVNSRTGETFDLEHGTWEQLATARKGIVDLRPELDMAARVLDSEIAHRLDRDNERARLVDGIELRVNAPTEAEWDVERLKGNLDQLVNEGRLGGGVPGRAVKVEVSYKPVARELAKLLAHDDERVRELVAECVTEVPARRRVTVGGTHGNRRT